MSNVPYTATRTKVLAVTPINCSAARRCAAPSGSSDTLPKIGIPRLRNLTERRKGAVELHHQQRCHQAGANTEREHIRHE